MTDNDVRVQVRFRPLNSAEIDATDGTPKQCVDFESQDTVAVRVQGDPCSHRFTFDHVFSCGASQHDVFESAGRPMVDDLFIGYNSTLLVYGQTGSGKTFTMSGPFTDASRSREDTGIVSRMATEVFLRAQSGVSTVQYEISVSMVEIYMERVRDLLDVTKQNLPIRDTKPTGTQVVGATTLYATTAAEVIALAAEGAQNRAVSSTCMNDVSSRSHSVLCLALTQRDTVTLEQKSAKMFLVDLAGSEKVQKTRAEGAQLEEAKNINKSLTTLGIVINALIDRKSSHIPYRDSKLTRLLQDALGGNSRTCFIVCCSPSAYNDSETLSSLRFGQRVKTVKNTAKINRVYTVEELRILVHEAQVELDKLRKGTSTNLVLGDTKPTTLESIDHAVRIAKLKSAVDEEKSRTEYRLGTLRASISESESNSARLRTVVRCCQDTARAREQERREWQHTLEELEQTRRDLGDPAALFAAEHQLSEALSVSLKLNEELLCAMELEKKSVGQILTTYHHAQCVVQRPAVARLHALLDSSPMAHTNATFEDLLITPWDARAHGVSGAIRSHLLNVTSLRESGMTAEEVSGDVALLESIFSENESQGDTTENGTHPAEGVANALQSAKEAWDASLPNHCIIALQTAVRTQNQLRARLGSMLRRLQDGVLSDSSDYTAKRHDDFKDQLHQLDATGQHLKREGTSMRLELSMMETKLSLRNDRIENIKLAIAEERRHCQELQEGFDQIRRVLVAERDVSRCEAAALRAHCDELFQAVPTAVAATRTTPCRIVRPVFGGGASVPCYVPVEE